MSATEQMPIGEGSYKITRPDGATYKGYAYYNHRDIPAVLIFDRERILNWFAESAINH